MSHVNFNINGNIGTDSILDKGNVNGDNRVVIDAKTEAAHKDLNNMEALEKLHTEGTLETSAHKNGRIASGIIGGFMCAAGIAAAVVATICTGGAAGIIAGAAATLIGSGMLSTSLFMKLGAEFQDDLAKMMEHLQQKKAPLTEEQPKVQPEAVAKAKVLFTQNALEKNMATLKTEFDLDISDRQFSSDENIYAFVNENIVKDEDSGRFVFDRSGAWENQLVNFAKNALDTCGIDDNDHGVTDKNVLIVKSALSQFICAEDEISDKKSHFNDATVRESLIEFIDNRMEAYAPGGRRENHKKFEMLSLMRAALTEPDAGNDNALNIRRQMSQMEEMLAVEQGVHLNDNIIVNEDNTKVENKDLASLLSFAA